MNKKQKIIVVVTIFALVLLCGGLTFAYFTSFTSSESGSTIATKGGTMNITYASGDGNIIMENIYPRAAAWVNKSFTVTGNNTTDLNMYYGISLVVDNNDFRSYLSYTLSGTNTSNNGNLIPDINDNVPIINSTKIYELGVGSFTKATNAVHTYSFKIFFLDTGKEQNFGQGANFAAHLVITSVNPDGNVVYNGTGRNVVLSEAAKVNNITKSFNVANYVNQETDYEMFLIVNENTYDNLTYSIKGTNVSNSGSMISNVSDVSIPSERDNTISLGKGKLSDLNTKHTYAVTFNENVSKTNLNNISKQVDTKLLRRNLYTFSGKIEITSGNKTIYSAVIKQGTKDNPTTSIGTAATTNEGLIKTTDDYGTAYYYRGAVENNYVRFAGMCWRIVRTTGSNDVKLVLYNNDSDNCTLTGEGLAYAKYASSYTSSFSDNHAHTSAGYMYGLEDDNTNTACLFNVNDTVVNKYSSYKTESACVKAGGKWAANQYSVYFSNVKESVALKNLNTWYNAKLTAYTDKLADVIWCNDKSVSGTTSTGYTFGIAGRGSNRSYSLICPNDYNGGKLSKYTVSDTTNGNGDLTYPIGLLTADEIMYAGGVAASNNTSSTQYLYTNTGKADLLLTPYQYNSNDNIDQGQATLHSAAFNGNNMYPSIPDTAKAIIAFLGVDTYLRPSIALKGNVSVSGSGSASDPFVVR